MNRSRNLLLPFGAGLVLLLASPEALAQYVAPYQQPVYQGQQYPQAYPGSAGQQVEDRRRYLRLEIPSVRFGYGFVTGDLDAEVEGRENFEVALSCNIARQSGPASGASNRNPRDNGLYFLLAPEIGYTLGFDRDEPGYYYHYGSIGFSGGLDHLFLSGLGFVSLLLGGGPEGFRMGARLGLRAEVFMVAGVEVAYQYETDFEAESHSFRIMFVLDSRIVGSLLRRRY